MRLYLEGVGVDAVDGVDAEGDVDAADYEVVLQKSIPLQTRQFVLHISKKLTNLYGN